MATFPHNDTTTVVPKSEDVPGAHGGGPDRGISMRPVSMGLAFVHTLGNYAEAAREQHASMICAAICDRSAMRSVRSRRWTYDRPWPNAWPPIRRNRRSTRCAKGQAVRPPPYLDTNVTRENSGRVFQYNRPNCCHSTPAFALPIAGLRSPMHSIRMEHLSLAELLLEPLKRKHRLRRSLPKLLSASRQ